MLDAHILTIANHKIIASAYILNDFQDKTLWFRRRGRILEFKSELGTCGLELVCRERDVIWTFAEITGAYIIQR